MSSPACCSPEKSMEKTLTMHRMQTMQGKTRLSRRCAKSVQKCAKVCRAPENGKSHEESYDSSWDFGALEGTRIPGPLIKSQMLYRLSYERIFCGKTIPPNNITTIGCKKQERHLKKRKIRLYTTKLLKKPLRPALQQLHQQAGIDADHRGRLAQIYGLALGQVG